jgi:predicted ATP-binding protein involved in virulence
MYIDSIRVKNFRSFEEAEIAFVHPDSDFGAMGMPRPRIRNVNLLVGDNGAGKSSLLKAISLACLGPVAGDSGIYPFRLIRRGAGKVDARRRLIPAAINASFSVDVQDGFAEGRAMLDSTIEISNRRDLEFIESQILPDDKHWEPIFSSLSPAFFFVGYGTERTIRPAERHERGSKNRKQFVRAQRVAGFFDDDASLVPLGGWLPRYLSANRTRREQVKALFNRLLGPGHYNFTGRTEGGEFLFEKKGVSVPMPALSDGYKALLSWLSDLLFHITSVCPAKTPLDQIAGIVMIDEIDMHLHPRWQMRIVPALARALPRIQFIVTSHSALIAGSLQWMNIIAMKPGPRQSTKLVRNRVPIHGLDADQILLSKNFGLSSTRTASHEQRLKALTLKARGGDQAAAFKLISAMGRGDDEVAGT